MSGVQIPIIYEDNHLLAVLKPVGVPVQEDVRGKADLLNLLKADLKQRYAKPGEVYLALLHRLDQPVDGVMLFAKTSKAAARLSDSLRRHQWEKTYLAVVHEGPKAAEGRLTDRLSVSKNAQGLYTVVAAQAEGRDAALRYRVLARQQGLALLQIVLETGRPHQIRVQLSSRGWPIVGDRRYGRNEKVDQKTASLALTALALRVEHPVQHQLLTLQAPWPTRDVFAFFAEQTLRPL